MNPRPATPRSQSSGVWAALSRLIKHPEEPWDPRAVSDPRLVADEFPAETETALVAATGAGA